MKFPYGWVLAGMALVLVGCAAPGLVASTAPGTPDFWWGLWHGMIFPITFVVSLFNHDVGVYSAVNNGAWYNFGFFLGIAISMGGSAAGSRGRRRKPQV